MGLYDGGDVHTCWRVRVVGWASLLAGLGVVACAGGGDEGGSGLSFGVTFVSQGSNPTDGDLGTTGGPVTTGATPAGPGSDSDSDSNNSNNNSGLPTFECGDGNADPNEDCDGVDLDAQTCESFGYSGGELKCAPDCTFDVSGCLAGPECGDGELQPDGGELCDCGGAGSPCTPAQLGGEDCTGQVSPVGTPFTGGTLRCNTPDVCSFDTALCTYCGDGLRNGPEACDGPDLGGQTCASQGFDGGTLKCFNNCTLDTSGCEKSVCGDGICAPNEDSCTCLSDCPDNPNTCSSCECGGPGGPNCFCDILCVINFDCCGGGPC